MSKPEYGANSPDLQNQCPLDFIPPEILEGVKQPDIDVLSEPRPPEVLKLIREAIEIIQNIDWEQVKQGMEQAKIDMDRRIEQLKIGMGQQDESKTDMFRNPNGFREKRDEIDAAAGEKYLLSNAIDAIFTHTRDRILFPPDQIKQ